MKFSRYASKSNAPGIRLSSRNPSLPAFPSPLTILAAFLLLLTGLTPLGCDYKDPLTPEERSWLKAHTGKIIVNNESGWPPIIDVDKDGKPFGIVMDYQRLLEKKLDFRFTMDKLDSWSNFMERFKKGEIHVNNNLQKNPERTEYALFTKPYIEIPNAIIVRKETKGSLTLENMRGMKIAVTRNFAIHNHIKTNYDDLPLMPLADDLTCLLETATGNADAAVVNLAVASYIIEQKGITNLRVAGYADYVNALCFASIKDRPILNRILGKGLALITGAERDAIYKKWISLETLPFYKQKKFLVVTGSTAVILAGIFMMIMLWNQSLKKQVVLRTENLRESNLQLKKEISERKHAQAALAEEKERLTVTLRSIGDGVITTDTNGRLVLINKVAEDLTGWSQQESAGKNINDVFHIINAHTRRKCENPVVLVLQAGKIIGLANHTILVARDGTERMIADSGAPIFDADSKIIGVVLVFRDVTEKHRIEKQLQQAQRIESIGLLAGGIAHDFNNMLGVITGNISYALSKIENHSELSEILSDVQDSTQQAQALTQQLLTFSKGGAPIKKTTNLNQIIKESARFVSRGEKTRCEFELADDLWAVQTDSGQISQAINNIVINANQAMPNGGVIQIKTENATIESQTANPIHTAPGQYVKITISDQGIGISEKHIARIFDPYFTTKQTGSGLGLATTYSIIKKHDGDITVHSELDKGTIFHIYLPATSVKYEPETVTKESFHQGQGRILILDDQEAILTMVGRMLNLMGYETAFTTDGTRTIETYREACLAGNPFDLVILDLTIPGGMGGVQTIAELIKIDPDVKAVVSSGYSNDPIMANYPEYGFCDVIPKPYTKSQLSEILNRIFNQNQSFR